jgi:hypothetical protein
MIIDTTPSMTWPWSIFRIFRTPFGPAVGLAAPRAS